MNYLKQKDITSACNQRIKENYPVTMTLPAWQDYVAKGKNTLLAPIQSDTVSIPFGSNSAVIKGHVRQGY